MSAAIPWSFTKNTQGDCALCRADQLVAVLQLALDVSRELQTLLQEILPDPMDWEDAKMRRRSKESQSQTA